MFPPAFDAFVPSSFHELLSQDVFRADYVPLDTIHATFQELESQYILSDLYAGKVTAPAIFDHCKRLVYLALCLLHTGFPSGSPEVTQITSQELMERVYLTCILHDLGLTNDSNALAHPANAMSFEIAGGFLAYDHLHLVYPAMDATKVGDVVQGIILHTVEFEKGKSSAAAWLLQISALFDVVGSGFDAMGPGSFSRLWHKDTVAEIEKLFPKADFMPELGCIFERETRSKVNCILSHSVSFDQVIHSFLSSDQF